MGRPTKHQQRHKNSGRPTKMDPIVIGKLEDAFSNGCSDREACLYAGINPDTLYEYQKKNPEFAERKEALKSSPLIQARKTVVKSLVNDVNSAWRYLEKKDPEMKPVQKIEHSGFIASESTSIEDLSPEEKEAMQKLREARRKRIEQKSDKLE